VDGCHTTSMRLKTHELPCAALDEACKHDDPTHPSNDAATSHQNTLAGRCQACRIECYDWRDRAAEAELVYTSAAMYVLFAILFVMAAMQELLGEAEGLSPWVKRGMQAALLLVLFLMGLFFVHLGRGGALSRGPKGHYIAWALDLIGFFMIAVHKDPCSSLSFPSVNPCC